MKNTGTVNFELRKVTNAVLENTKAKFKKEQLIIMHHYRKLEYSFLCQNTCSLISLEKEYYKVFKLSSLSALKGHMHASDFKIDRVYK